jgi:hypothetical protein
MTRYTAQVWVSGDHPYDAEINAANVFQARRNIARREGVKEHEVNRVFEIHEEEVTSSSNNMSAPDVGGSMGLLMLGGAGVLLFMFTPWVLMFLGGATGTWIGEKVTRTDVGEARGKAGAILLTLIMLGGGFGFVKGHEFQQYMQETTTEEQVYQQ